MAHHDTCGAPICRQDGGDGWYPDEEICSVSPREPWQNTQAKIQRRFFKGEIDNETYYTKAMLEVIDRVKPRLKGLNPDKPAEKQAASVAFKRKYRVVSAVKLFADIEEVL